MDISDFTTHYAQLADNELLRLLADENTLVPEAVIALEGELRRRGLKKQDAVRLKKRLDTLEAREVKGPLTRQIAEIKYERDMRRFVGWKEPEFYSPYGSRDIRTAIASIRHRYRVWKAFRDHTGHWPVFSIWFHFLSLTTVFGFAVAAFFWVQERNLKGWSVAAVFVLVLALFGIRDFGARLIRKLDWKRYGS